MKTTNIGLRILCAVSLFSIGCQPSFEKNPSGMEYRFLEKNEDAQKAKWGDILHVSMTYRTILDSVLFDSRTISDSFRIILKKPEFKGSIEEGFAMMHVGDSAEFKVDAQKFYDITLKEIRPEFIPVKSPLIFQVRLNKISELAEYEKELDKAKKKMAEQEKTKINDYLKANNIMVPKLISGAYYIENSKGKGKQANFDNVVDIRYTGKFLDGRVFDTNLKENKPLRFKVGSRDVIDGLSEALQRMQVGGKSTTIIPSSSAYGEKGKGPIPPYTPVMFEIELVDVLK